MQVLVSNNSGFEAGRLAGMYPGRVGHLYSPNGFRQRPYAVPYALDNGRFALMQGKEWDEPTFLAMLDSVRWYVHRGDGTRHEPMFVTVPDVPGDHDATADEWERWHPQLRERMPLMPLAFVAQDGCQAIPDEADWVFVGGSTAWKWGSENIERWASCGKPCHVGRVNGSRGLWRCHAAGVRSCDGTGWFRGDESQLQELRDYLAESSAGLLRTRGVDLWPFTERLVSEHET